MLVVRIKIIAGLRVLHFLAWLVLVQEHGILGTVAAPIELHIGLAAETPLL